MKPTRCCLRFTSVKPCATAAAGRNALCAASASCLLFVSLLFLNACVGTSGGADSAFVSPADTEISAFDFGPAADVEESYAVCFNNIMQLSGMLEDANGRRAVIWAGGKLENLQHGDSNTIAMREYVKGINDSGMVVGYTFVQNGNKEMLKAFYWENGQWSFLLYGAGAAMAVNNSGEIAGFTGDFDNAHAVLWDRGAQIDLGIAPGSDATVPMAINNKGEVVVSGTTKRWEKTGEHEWWEVKRSRGFIWRNGGFMDLGNLDGGNVEPAGINDSAQVVGEALTSDGEPHAFIWQAGRMVDLGSRPMEDVSSLYSHLILAKASKSGPKRYWSTATSINNLGQVVGSYGTGPKRINSRAFLFEDGKMIDLNSLLPPESEWVLKFARQINNNGQILGRGAYRGEPYRDFILTLPARLQHRTNTL